MPIHKSRFPGIWILAIALLLPAAACFNANPETGREIHRREQPVPTVEIVEAKRGSLPIHEQLTGNVKALNQTGIYPEITGRIVEVLANNGDRVKRGDILVRLRDDELRERLTQARHDRDVAQAQLRQAEVSVQHYEAQLRRTREMVEFGLQSASELEALEADATRARASVDLARAQLSRAEARIEEQKSALQNTVVRAPISGILGNRNAEIGMRVDGGTRLFEIGDSSNIKITIIVTERQVNRFRQGNRARIRSPYLDKPVETTIRRLSPFLDPVTHTAVAEIELSNPGNILQPGMFVTVDVFHGAAEEAQILPKAALFEHPGNKRLGIYAAEPEAQSGKASVTFIPVEIATDNRDSISVRETGYRWVVVNGQHQLAEWNSREANVRIVDWDRVVQLQQLQARDLLKTINSSTAAR